VFINAALFEGLPLSVLEAADKGLYLVLSDIPQHRLLRMPECSYVDPYALNLTEALPVRENMGQANREHVRHEYSIHKMLKAYKEVYGSLV
jgi:glycosyltransferase involved in cell wall biosynthesis